MDERELRELIRAVVEGAMADGGGEAAHREPPPRPAAGISPQDLKLAKRVATWTGAAVPTPPALNGWRPRGDRAYFLARTPARLGVGSAGPRYRTATVLKFLTDHAAARDAVADAVSPDVMAKLGMVSLKSAAKDRAEFLKRPDLGRRLSDESREVVQKKGIRSPQVQIVAADGLSATALNVNLPIVLPILTAELQKAGVRVGTPYVVNLGRVIVADEVARLADAEVLCLLVGERPGLQTAESMGAYVTYMKVRQFNEAMRSLTSNIHQGGLPPTEAARQIAQIIVRALKDKRTGVDPNG